jgi:hypothetical protein
MDAENWYVEGDGPHALTIDAPGYATARSEAVAARDTHDEAPPPLVRLRPER